MTKRTPLAQRLQAIYDASRTRASLYDLDPQFLPHFGYTL